MVDQSRVLDVLSSSGLSAKSVDDYRKKWDKLRAGLHKSDMVDALCSVDEAMEWIESNYKPGSSRQKFLCVCKWPFVKVPELTEHPAGKQWTSLHETLVTKPNREKSADLDVPIPSDDVFAALQTSSDLIQGEIAIEDMPLDHDSHAGGGVPDDTQGGASVGEHQLQMDESLPPIDDDADGNDEFVPLPPAAIGGGHAVNLAVILQDVENVLSFPQTSLQHFTGIRVHQDKLANFLEKHARILSGVASDRIACFKSLEWSLLRGSGRDNRITLSEHAGEVLAFGGRASDAPLSALATAYSGAGEDALSLSLVSRQVGCTHNPATERSNGKTTLGTDRPSVALDITTTAGSELRLVRTARQKVDKAHSVTGDCVIGWEGNKQVLYQDNMIQGVKVSALVEHMQKLGVSSPMFDVRRALNTLCNHLSKPLPESVEDQLKTMADDLVEVVKSFLREVKRVDCVARAQLDCAGKKNKTPGQKRATALLHQARLAISSIHETWTSASLAAVASATAESIKTKATDNFRTTVAARLAHYVGVALPGAQLEIEKGSPLIKLPDSNQAVSPRCADLSTFFAFGFAAHAAMCEARVPDVNISMIGVHDIPGETIDSALRTFADFVKRNTSHVVMLALPYGLQPEGFETRQGVRLDTGLVHFDM